ncbi:MAG: DMT family transporter [Rhizobiaceae bacterium]
MTSFLLTALTMIAFAANSVLARIALGGGLIDPAGYSLVRLASGALVLFALAMVSGNRRSSQPEGSNGLGGNWLSALALFAYAVFFSFSYVAIGAGIGALILFASVQGTMIGWGLYRGDRPSAAEWTGLIIAFGAFAWLVSPGLSAPDPLAATLMAIAGIAWGAYSVRGRGVVDPLGMTAGNFMRTVPMVLALAAIFLPSLGATAPGVALAFISGAITSGLGYALWYRVLRSLTGTQAAIVQLTVPVIAGIGGTLALSEAWTLRFVIASALILGGVAIAILAKAKRLA